MEADAPAFGQSDKVVGLDKTKSRVESGSIGSGSGVVPMKADSTLKTVHILVATIAGVVVIISGILGVALYMTDRMDRLETAMDMRIDRLEDNLSMRIVESENRTNKNISDVTRGIERLEDVLIGRSEKQFSLGAPVRGDVESP